MGLEFSTMETSLGNRKLHGAIVELDNSVLAFFWEGDKPRLGTLSVTLPDRSSSPLLGDRDRQICLILGSHISTLTGKMALVSVNLPIGLGKETSKALVGLAQNITNRMLEDST